MFASFFLTLFVVSQALQLTQSTPKSALELAFTVPGQGRQLIGDFRGKTIVLQLIQTTCPSCEQAAQMMDRLNVEFAGRNVQVVQVAFNPNASVLAERFTEAQKLKTPIGWTTRDQVCAFLGLSTRDRFAVPQVVLIDAKGAIRYQTPAEGTSDLRNEAKLRQLIAEIIPLER